MPKPSGIFLLALAVVATACSSGAPSAGTIPTVEQAHRMLDRAVTLARARDFEGLCSLGDGNCRRHLDMAGRDAIPPDPPTVVGTRAIPTTTTAGNQTHLGGIVLILCGIDANGDHYDSEMLVFHGGNGLEVINPIYWGRIRIGDSTNPVTAETFPPVSC
jgi:hypothetical protein